MRPTFLAEQLGWQCPWRQEIPGREQVGEQNQKGRLGIDDYVMSGDHREAGRAEMLHGGDVGSSRYRSCNAQQRCNIW